MDTAGWFITLGCAATLFAIALGMLVFTSGLLS